MQYNEPLGLPQGTVRAIITLVLLLSTLLLLMFGITSEYLNGLTSLAVGFYIGTRTSETQATPRSESEPVASKAEVRPVDDDEVDTTTVIPG